MNKKRVTSLLPCSVVTNVLNYGDNIELTVLSSLKSPLPCSVVMYVRNNDDNIELSLPNG